MELLKVENLNVFYGNIHIILCPYVYRDRLL